jgi:hypothetical protein
MRVLISLEGPSEALPTLLKDLVLLRLYHNTCVSLNVQVPAPEVLALQDRLRRVESLPGTVTVHAEEPATD